MSEKVLVMITTNQSNKAAIRFAVTMAKAYNGSLTALYVESPHDIKYSEAEKKTLDENMKFAENQGADLITVYGTDIARQIAEYAIISNIGKIVLPKLSEPRLTKIFRKTIADKLSVMMPNADICIIPSGRHFSDSMLKTIKQSDIRDIDSITILKGVLILLVATLLGRGMFRLGISEFNIIPLYILATLIVCMSSKNRTMGICATVVGVLLFNFFFTEPHFSLKAHGIDYIVSFIIMLIVGILISMLASRVQTQAHNAIERAYRTEIFFETSRSLESANNFNEVIDKTAIQLEKMLKRPVVFYAPDSKGMFVPVAYAGGEDAPDTHIPHEYATNDEKSVANWAGQNNRNAGTGTDTFINSKCLYMPIKGNPSPYAVVGIVMNGDTLTAFEKDLVVTLLSECSGAIERDILNREKMNAEIKAQKEELQSTLLRAISHDLRTPLTGISGNAYILMSDSEKMSQETKLKLYGDIYDDSIWLCNLVENLLSSSRIAGDTINAPMNTEILSEVLEEALLHVSRKKEFYNINIIEKEDLLLVKMDTRLIIQVFVNLIDNAMKYSPAGSNIDIILSKEGSNAIVSVCDEGIGVSEQDKEKIFEMFYSGNNKNSDSRRGMGLGLSLCQSIIKLHGGKIGVRDNIPKGTVIYFTMPLEEVHLNE